MWMFVLVLALNLGASWLNCWSVGRIWHESKAVGGWLRVLAWSGAVQAAIGFSSVIGFALGAILDSCGLLPEAVAGSAMSLWYLLVIIPALATGTFILVQSWIEFARDRSLMNLSAAAYNTLAMAHNAYSAIDGIGHAFAGVEKLFALKDDDEEGSALILFCCGLVLAAIGFGAVLTYTLVRRYAGTLDLPLGSAPMPTEYQHYSKPGYNGR